MTQVAKLSVPLTILFKFVLLLNLPFALGALMYAYESSRHVAPRQPLSRQTAWGCLATNIAMPGFGSWWQVAFLAMGRWLWL